MILIPPLHARPRGASLGRVTRGPHQRAELAIVRKAQVAQHFAPQWRPVPISCPRVLVDDVPSLLGSVDAPVRAQRIAYREGLGLESMSE